ncbi:MAG: cohesin domain-containing protein [Patescibacteria group bacterium]
MKRYIFVLLIALGILHAVKAEAAVLSVQAQKNNFEIGEQFTISIKLDSEGVGINAAQATLNYPADIVQILSVDKSDSVFNFWLSDPVFDNSKGILSFVGGSTNGFTGKSLHILSARFKVNAAGKAAIKLMGGAVTSSDGNGTNVLRLLQGIEIAGVSQVAEEIKNVTPESEIVPEAISLPAEILPAPIQIVRTPEKASGMPLLPALQVPLYKSGEWSNVVANFLAQWTLPADVTDVATAVNSNPKFSPVASEGLFDNKFFPALKDGVSYLHVRFKNSIGWGDTAHYKILIDTVPPASFEAKMEANIGKDGSTEEPAPVITYESADQLSGIDKYFIQIDNSSAVETADEKFALPLQLPGEHSVRVRALDVAGNGTESLLKINILPIASPIISSITEKIFSGEGGLNIGGDALPNISVSLILKNEAGAVQDSKITSSTPSGKWLAEFDRALKKGKYFVEVRAKDGRGAQSFPVASKRIIVRDRPLVVVGGLELSSFWALTSVIILLLLSFGLGFYANYLAKLQRGRREIIARRDTVAAISLLKRDVSRIIDGYKGKKMTPQKMVEMQTFLKRLDASLDKINKYLPKEIKEIIK